jgi:inositol 1,4,5-triphosphate receptor type 3
MANIKTKGGILRLGDLISLRTSDASLHAEGILLDDLNVCSPDNFDGSIFSIQLQRQYTAARELEDFIEMHNAQFSTDPNTLKYLHALQTGCDNEIALNESYMRQKSGTPIRFGDTIQLLHVKSGKFVTVIPDELARDERENLKLQLSEEGNPYSWFELSPRYKIDRAGEVIQGNAEVFLRVAKRQNEYIHCATRYNIIEKSQEVNCSLENTPWTLALFQTYSGSISEKHLVVSELVLLHDPETFSNLSVSFRTESDEAESVHVRYPDVNSSGKILLEPKGREFDSASLWTIAVHGKPTKGGPIDWQQERIQFRNMNSGLYIGVNGEGECYCTPDSASPDTSFAASELYSKEQHLGDKNPLQISHDTKSGLLWLQRGDTEENSVANNVKMTKDRAKALSLIIMRFKDRDHFHPDAISSKSNEPRDVFFGVSATQYLDKYMNMIRVDKLDGSLSSIWPDGNRFLFDAYISVLLKTIFFVNGMSVGTQLVKADIEFTLSITPREHQDVMKRRQDLLREQGTVKMVLLTIEKLIPISHAEGKDKATFRPVREDQVVAKSQLPIVRMGNSVLTCLFYLLNSLVYMHPKNQMYVADFLPVLLEHLDAQPLSGKCVEMMLSSNMELQETKIGQREISIFIERLRKAGMNRMYLRLLRSCCSCQGKGVDANQCIIAERLFSDMNTVTMQLHADHSTLKPVEWFGARSASLYLDKGPDAVTGGNLLSKGLPAIYITWTPEYEAFDPAKLYGKTAVPILHMFKKSDHKNFLPMGLLTEPAVNKSSSNRRAIGTFAQHNTLFDSADPNKLEIMRGVASEYFIAQLYLAADMCLDRNYKAMAKLESVFPYDLLVTILRLNVEDGLKAAVVSLIVNLHLDRDPQILSIRPLLSRTWSDIAKESDPKMPYVEDSRSSSFALLQLIISENIRSMKGSTWTIYSKEILHLLSKLVSFNYYGKKEKLDDIIDPLISALDRRMTGLDDNKKEKKTIFTRSSSSRSMRPGSILVKSKSKIFRSGRFKRTSSEGKIVPASTPPSSPERPKTLKAIQEDAEEDDDIEGKDDVVVTGATLIGEQVDYESDTDSDVSKESEISLVDWRVVCLDILESVQVMVIILLVVLGAVAMTTYQFISNADDTPGTALYAMGMVFLFIFVFEFSLRMYCYSFVYGEITTFLRNFYNLIDVFVIMIDVIFLALPEAGDAGEFGPVLRLARTIKFVRVLRAARIVSAFTGLGDKQIKWINPPRYKTTSAHEIKTMVAVVDVLSEIQTFIDDRNVALFMRAFYIWVADSNDKSAVEVFDNIVKSNSDLSISVGTEFDDIFLDVLMFQDTDLVQSSLDAIMSIHLSRMILLRNSEYVQLIVAPERERQFRLVRQMLLILERNAETQELWGGLETEEDVSIAKQTTNILVSLIEALRVPRTVMHFDERYAPDPETQIVLRNLDFISVSQKIYVLMDSIKDFVTEDEAPSVACVKDITLLCNNVMYWFCLDNAENQALVFEYLDFYVDSLDNGTGTDKVILAMFKGNETLMRQCSLDKIELMVDLICKEGNYPEYLVLLASISHAGQSNIVENQFEIVKYICSVSRIDKVLLFMCPIEDPEYERKISLMEPYLNEIDIEVDELPAEIAYHLYLLDVLSGCTVGRQNVTTVETKVQSLFDFTYIIDAMLDPRCILLAKVRMGLYFYNAIIEVEMMVPGLEYSSHVWNLIEASEKTFEDGFHMLKVVTENGWSSPLASRQTLEYMVVTAMFLEGFFSRYYDPRKFRLDAAKRSNQRIPVNKTSEEISEIIERTGRTLSKVARYETKVLSASQKRFLTSCLALFESASKKNVAVEMTSNETASMSNQTVPTKKNSAKVLDGDDVENDDTNDLKQKYKNFIDDLTSDKGLMEDCMSDNDTFISAIDRLLFESDTSVEQTDKRYAVRKEPLLRKLATHVGERLTSIRNKKHLDLRCTKTTTWLIKSFRTMIEKKWNMTIDERDDEGGAEQDEAGASTVDAFNRCGITTLCLDLISLGIDKTLQLEVIKLCVAMLFKEGGALAVQETMYAHLTSRKSDLFFLQIRNMLQSIDAGLKWQEVQLCEEDEEPDLPEEIIVLRFLQLMCEGHYCPNQDILREQPDNEQSVNLLDDFVSFLNTLSRSPYRVNILAALNNCATILEVIQGPCEQNQSHFALNTELIETLNRLMRLKLINDCKEDELTQLKRVCIDIFQGLLEAQGAKSLVYERVLSVIHLDIITLLSALPDETSLVTGTGTNEAEEEEAEEDDEDLAILRTECLVLIQMLCDFKPSLRDELGLADGIEAIVGQNVSSIEVTWRGELQRRFFHVPKICGDLAKASKDTLVEDVDRTNLESKLSDFLFRSHDLYREIKHQQLLKEYKISGIFSRTNQNRSTWIAFILTCIINAIFLFSYNDDGAEDGGRPSLGTTVSLVIQPLNVIQIVVAAFTLLLFLIVRVPVKHQFYIAAGYGEYTSWLNAMTEPLTLYYFIYLAIATVGLTQHELLPLLLLDICVKNSTTRDVLNAVVFPYKQLGMTMILGFFVIYIFAFILFYRFRDDFEDDAEKDCESLFKCTLTTVNYGLRLQGGIGDIMTHTLVDRYIVDLLFFFIVLIVLMNVIFGIIIDTFGELRSRKADRHLDTTEKCFICGIDKQVFDRLADGPDGFKEHIRLDHNMWNYFYFIIYIWEQDKDDDDGLEQFVRRCIEAGEMIWFPMNKAMRLNLGKGDEEDLREALQKDVAATEEKLMGKLKSLKTEMTTVLEQLASKLDQEGTHLHEGIQSMLAPRKASVIAVHMGQIEHQRRASIAPSLNSHAESKDISIQLILVEVTGIELTKESTFFCRISGDSGAQTVQMDSFNGTCIKMQSTKLTVCDKYDPISMSDKVVKATMMKSINERNIFLGSVEIAYNDLVSADDLYVETSFEVLRPKREGSLIVKAFVDTS